MKTLKVIGIILGFFGYLFAPFLIINMIAAFIWGSEIIDHTPEGHPVRWIDITLVPAMTALSAMHYVYHYMIPNLAVLRLLPVSNNAEHPNPLIRWATISHQRISKQNEALTQYLDLHKN